MFFAEKKRHAAEDAEAAIDETPGERYSPDRSGDERERNDAGAGDESEIEEPAIADRIAVRADECDGED